MDRLKNILKRVDDMPVFPQTAQTVLSMMNDPKTHILKVAEAIQKDVSLSVRLLKMSNSAYYAQGRKIVTVLEALVLLGMNTVKELLVAASAYKILNKKIEGYLLERGDLWKHSLFCAMASETLASEAAPSLKDKAYIAGLLHDVGKIILAHYVQEEFEKILAKVERENISFDSAEKDVLGFTHAELGARVLEKWNFPEEIVDAIEFHHDPKEAKFKPLAGLVHLGDMATIMLGVGLGSDGLFYPLDENVFDSVGLSGENFEKLFGKISANLDVLSVR